MKALIVGSGLAGVTVAEALAKSGRHDLCLVTAEKQGYYSRPLLSHGISRDEDGAARIVMKRFDALAPGIRVLHGTRVEGIDREAKRVVLEDGTSLPYDVLVLATGSAARIPPPLMASWGSFFTLNSLDDLLLLRQRRAECVAAGVTPRWAVIGGGLIGCELASDLHKAGDLVTVFHREERLLELQLSEIQSLALHEHFSARRVALHYDQDVRAIVRNGSRTEVVTAEGVVGPFHGAIVSTGFAPRIELARDAGLATSRGIVVDERLRTADSSVYALGDVAQIGGRLFPFVSPIRSQALWLAEHLEGGSQAPWVAPRFSPVIKIHGLKPPVAAEAA